MNRDTVLKCARIAAEQRIAVLGMIDADIVELLQELDPIPAPDAPAAAPVVEAVAEPVAEAPAEEAVVEGEPAAEAPAEAPAAE